MSQKTRYPACDKWHPGEDAVIAQYGKSLRCKVCESYRYLNFNRKKSMPKRPQLRIGEFMEDGKYRPRTETPYGILPPCNWTPPERLVS